MEEKESLYTPFAHTLNYFKFMSLFAPSTTAHVKLAAKLLSFVGLLLGYASLVIYTIELNSTSEQCSKFISGYLAERDSKPSLRRYGTA